MRWRLLAFVMVLSVPFALGHWCSCFPGCASYTDYMCAYPDRNSPSYSEEDNGFSFNVHIEQWRAEITSEFGGGCPVRDDVDRLEDRNQARDGPGTPEDNLCGVPITMDNFEVEDVECQKNLGEGWNPCDGDELDFSFGDPSPSSFTYDYDYTAPGWQCTRDPSSDAKKSRVPVFIEVTTDADEGEYRIKLRAGWDPDLYNPPAFGDCSGDGCSERVGDSYKDLEVTIDVPEPCIPDCDGKECGDDGCGGVCGTCDAINCTGEHMAGSCQIPCESGLCGDACITRCRCADGYFNCDDDDDNGCESKGIPSGLGSYSNPCTNETCDDMCETEGDTMCDEELVMTCGDYDDDSCLEWSLPEECPAVACQVGVCSTSACSYSFLGLDETDDLCYGNTGCVGGQCYCDGAGMCYSKARVQCFDGIQDLDETDVDCGGPMCDLCPQGKKCRVDNDCETNFCKDGVCEEFVCTDGDKRTCSPYSGCYGTMVCVDGQWQECMHNCTCDSTAECPKKKCMDVECIGGRCEYMPGDCECVPSWECGPWSECINNIQERVCKDEFDCGTNLNRPLERRGCGSLSELRQKGRVETAEPKKDYDIDEVIQEKLGGKWMMVTTVVAAIFIIMPTLFVILYQRRRQ